MQGDPIHFLRYKRAMTKLLPILWWWPDASPFLARHPRKIPISWCTKGRRVPVPASTSCFSLATMSTGRRNRCPRSRRLLPGTTASSAACSSRRTRKRLHRPDSSTSRDWKRCAGPTCWSSSCASRTSPTIRCSTSSTPGPRRADRRLPHGNACVSDPEARREVPEVHVARRAGLSGRIRPSDPRRDLGHALRQEPRAELEADTGARTGNASDPAWRQGRVGAVGRLYRQSDRGQHHPRDGKILDCMKPDSPAAKESSHAVAWIGPYTGASGKRAAFHNDRGVGSAERRLPGSQSTRSSERGLEASISPRTTRVRRA